MDFYVDWLHLKFTWLCVALTCIIRGYRLYQTINSNIEENIGKIEFIFIEIVYSEYGLMKLIKKYVENWNTSINHSWSRNNLDQEFMPVENFFHPLVLMEPNSDVEEIGGNRGIFWVIRAARSSSKEITSLRLSLSFTWNARNEKLGLKTTF